MAKVERGPFQAIDSWHQGTMICPADPRPSGSLFERELKKENRMETGRRKMWNTDRGFEFVADDRGGGADTFPHISELARPEHFHSL